MSKTQQNVRWIQALFLSLSCAITACTASEVESNPDMKPIACTLSVDAIVSQGAEVLVAFRLENRTEKNLEVLRYHTPLEDLIGPVFEVRYEGNILPYRGPMVKRSPPTDEDWLELNPDHSLANELDISLAWELDRKGSYSLRLNQDVSYRESGKPDVQSMPAADCPEVAFQIK